MVLPTISVLIREELIDRLVIREIACDPAFARWFVERCGVRVLDGRVTELNQSRTRRGRETDVEIHWTADDGHRLLLLVENKINAAFQPEQLEDYHARGQGMIRSGKVDEYRVVLLAPHRYLARSASDAAKADVQIAYEDMRAFFDESAERSIRHAYSCNILANAIGKGEHKYTTIADVAVTGFWDHYLESFHTALPGWTPKKAQGVKGARPEKSDIIYVYPPDKTQRGLRIAHKLKKGVIELSFEGAGQYKAEFEEYMIPRVTAECTVAWSGAKGAVRRSVPRVSPWDPFEPQMQDVEAAIGAAAELVQWFSPHNEWWRAFRARPSNRRELLRE